MSNSRALGTTGKEVVSSDTKVETKFVPVGNNSVQKITISTTKTIYGDGSVSTNTETRTVTETIQTSYSQRETTTIITGSSSSPVTKSIRGSNVPAKKSQDGGSSSSSSSSDSDSDEDSEFSAFQRQALKAHNEYRKTHGAPPLKLSKKICQTAENWVNGIAAKGHLEHSSGSGYGENIYWASGNVNKGEIPVDSWYSEIKDYKFGGAGYQSNTGHFTQVVWKDSTELGIAKAPGRNGTFVVANYNPPGNFQGQYAKNVLPPS